VMVRSTLDLIVVRPKGDDSVRLSILFSSWKWI
jgi:hypothetical protein